MRTIERLQFLLFYLLLFLLPSNLGYHFINKSSYVQGILVDYLVPTVYLSDILIFILLALWLMHLGSKLIRLRHPPVGGAGSKLKLKNYKFVGLVLLLLFLGTQYAVAVNKIAFVYKLVRLMEMGWLFWWISRHFSRQLAAKMTKHWVVIIICASVIFQSLLAIGQWSHQGSLFGYWFLGEQPFMVATAGVKTISFFGRLKVLPMGTFPHPNILAGWLVVSLVFILLHKEYPYHSPRKHLIDPECSACSRVQDDNNNLLAYSFYLIAFFFGLISLFLTFSWPAWIVMTAALVYILFDYLKPLATHQAWFFIALAFIGIVLVSAWYFGYWLELSSLARRWQLNTIAFNMWLSSPWTGVGLNNFIPRLAEFGEVVASVRFFQPVHNVFLLILAETGIIGVGIFLWGIVQFIKPKTLTILNSNTLIFFSLLFLSLFDHYFLTTQQGLLMLVIFIRLSI
jgi:hypothetical protein